MILSRLFILKANLAECLLSSDYFKVQGHLVPRLYGNKKGRQNRLKILNWPIWNKFGTFDREINKEHKQIPKRYFNRLLNYHGTQHINHQSLCCALKQDTFILA